MTTLIGLCALIALLWASIRAPRGMTLGLWSFLSAALISAALFIVIPGEARDRAFWIAMLFPFIWVFLQISCYWLEKRWQAPAIMAAVSALSMTVIFLMSPGH